MEDYRIVVIADGTTDAAKNNNKGHLYERFIALLLREYSYDTPHERNINPTSQGTDLTAARVRLRPILGGLINEYSQAA